MPPAGLHPGRPPAGHRTRRRGRSAQPAGTARERLSRAGRCPPRCRKSEGGAGSRRRTACRSAGAGRFLFALATAVARRDAREGRGRGRAHDPQRGARAYCRVTQGRCRAGEAERPGAIGGHGSPGHGPGGARGSEATAPARGGRPGPAENSRFRSAGRSRSDRPAVSSPHRVRRRCRGTEGPGGTPGCSVSHPGPGSGPAGRSHRLRDGAAARPADSARAGPPARSWRPGASGFRSCGMRGVRGSAGHGAAAPRPATDAAQFPEAWRREGSPDATSPPGLPGLTPHRRPRRRYAVCHGGLDRTGARRRTRPPGSR